jgi:hypothetical protein
LLETYQERNRELTESNASLLDRAEQYDSLIATQKSNSVAELEKYKKDVNPSILEKYSSVISELSESKQIEFLRSISEDTKTPDFGNKPEST